MPFGGPSANSYGTHPGSTHRQSEVESSSLQAPPLRSRGRPVNGSSASSSPSDLLFSHPTESSFEDFPYPPYSELPFTSLKRKKQQQNSGSKSFVKWAMRSVLLSPVIVLVFWSLGAMIFSKNVVHRSNSNSNNNGSSNNMNSSNRRRNSIGNNRGNMRRMTTAENHGMDYNLLVQHSNPSQLEQLQQQQALQYQGLTLQQQQQQQQQQFQQNQPQLMNMNGMQLPAHNQMPMAYRLPPPIPLEQVSQQLYGVNNPQLQQQQQLLLQQQQPMNAPPMYGSTMSQNNDIQTNSMMASPLQQQQQQQQQNQQASMASNPIVQPLALQQQQQQQQQQQPLSAQTEAVPEPAMGDSVSVEGQPRSNFLQQQQQKPLTSSTTVLYYDPKQTTTDANGQVKLPNMVYDRQGNEVDLSNLAAASSAGRQATQILMEPPPLSAAVRTQTQPEQQSSPAQTQEAPSEERTLMEQPEAQMAAPDIKKWGESTSQDQNIIVGTVAVMAMLVGALSAKRLRSRSVLSACIENESLEDDVAYDAAYSTTMPQHAGAAGSSYNTFGWKGDLEKFDV